MISALKRRYIHEQYLPGWLGMLINPFYHARRGLYQAILPLAAEMSGRVLDIGCGQKPYQTLFSATVYVGLEYDSPTNRACKKADFFYDGTHFPFADGEFDSALCSQVLEHVFTPDAFLTEINRVIKPGGKLLLTLPFVWDEHEQPYDFARYSSFGLKALLERHGFDVLQQRKTLPDVRVIFQLVNAYLYKLLMMRNPYINMVICAFFMAPFTMLGALLVYITPRNPDLYLDNVVLAIKRSVA